MSITEMSNHPAAAVMAGRIEVKMFHQMHCGFIDVLVDVGQ